MSAWAQALLVCYFIAMTAALIKAARYALDARRREGRYYLIGIPANISLAIALAGLAIMTGNRPVWSGYWLLIVVRLSFIVWAVLALVFEVCHVRTFLHISKIDEEEKSEHGSSV